jgi:hypothetical protein
MNNSQTNITPGGYSAVTAILPEYMSVGKYEYDQSYTPGL